MKDIFQRPLFVLEMANNHMGSVEHGVHMIETFGKIAKKHPFQFAFKFQFRDLDTFIHPEYKSRMELKYIKRFSETKLTKEQFEVLKRSAEENGFITMCTPFDEASVQAVEDFGFDILKIASCSFTDWPLLERVVKTNLPIIASTASATLEQIDNVNLFFRNREKTYAFMQCTGEYPTQRSNLNLNQIDLLKARYPKVPIGYSTHEEPDNMDSIMVAVAKGATIFEKHVAVVTPEFPKNAYSATPDQVETWLHAAQTAFEICGLGDERTVASDKEKADLRQFQRGVFASKPLKKGELLTAENTFYAFPNTDGQLVANEVAKYIDRYAETDVEANAPIFTKNLRTEHRREKLFQVAQKARKLLDAANSVVPGMASLEISHHYGLDKFDEFGCTIINVVNREYCKKLILVFPEQKHPEQYHKIKEETFVVLFGEVTLKLDGVDRQCKRGDIVTVGRGVKHFFTSQTGAVIEEISSTHHKEDSYYTDPKISENKNRKTILNYWMDVSP